MNKNNKFYAINVKKDQLQLITIKKARLFIDQCVITVLGTARKESPYGRKQDTKRKPHVINVALVLNIKNNLIYSMLTEIPVIADIQI